MKCEKCGAENVDGSKFCTECGAPLAVNTAPAPEEAPAPDAAPVPEAAPVPDAAFIPEAEPETTTAAYENQTEKFIREHPVQQMNSSTEQTPPNQNAAAASGTAMFNQAAPDALTPKSKLAAGLLGIFLGAFGVHNFYLGYTTKAIIQVCVSAVCILLACCSFGHLWILMFGATGMGIWGFVEGILILAGSIKVDGKGVPLKE